MKNMMSLENSVAYLREHPTAQAYYEDYTLKYDKKTDTIVTYHYDPSVSKVWGVQPITHIPSLLFKSQFMIVKSKGE